jgi:hypothetical protein
VTVKKYGEQTKGMLKFFTCRHTSLTSIQMKPSGLRSSVMFQKGLLKIMSTESNSLYYRYVGYKSCPLSSCLFQTI